MPLEPSLVNRRTAQTRAEIIEAAMSLFTERGFDDVPMAEVATAAGVSRRTLYRYFPAKEDIVFESPREWLAEFDRIVAARAPEETTRDVIRRAVLAVTDYVEERRARVTREFSVLMGSPALQARRSRSDNEWIEHYVEVIAPDVSDDKDGFLQALVCASSLVAAQNAVMVVWATTPGADATALGRSALDQLDGIWPSGTR